MPQKRLLLRWMRARSERRPMGSGRKPAMSPWLRSIPVTTRVFGSEGDGSFVWSVLIYIERHLFKFQSSDQKKEGYLSLEKIIILSSVEGSAEEEESVDVTPAWSEKEESIDHTILVQDVEDEAHYYDNHIVGKRMIMGSVSNHVVNNVACLLPP